MVDLYRVVELDFELDVLNLPKGLLKLAKYQSRVLNLLEQPIQHLLSKCQHPLPLMENRPEVHEQPDLRHPLSRLSPDPL